MDPKKYGPGTVWSIFISHISKFLIHFRPAVFIVRLMMFYVLYDVLYYVWLYLDVLNNNILDLYVWHVTSVSQLWINVSVERPLWAGSLNLHMTMGNHRPWPAFRCPLRPQLHTGTVKVSIGKAPPCPMKLTLNIDTITLQREIDEDTDTDVDSQVRSMGNGESRFIVVSL